MKRTDSHAYCVPQRYRTREVMTTEAVTLTNSFPIWMVTMARVGRRSLRPRKKPTGKGEEVIRSDEKMLFRPKIQSATGGVALGVLHPHIGGGTLIAKIAELIGASVFALPRRT
jgi:hypothetical protein